MSKVKGKRKPMRASKGNWTPEEVIWLFCCFVACVFFIFFFSFFFSLTKITQDQLLREVVIRHNGKSWKKIAEHLEGREDTQCLHRWQKVLNPKLVKGPWTKEVFFLLFFLSYFPSTHFFWFFFLLHLTFFFFFSGRWIGYQVGEAAWTKEMVSRRWASERKNWETMPWKVCYLFPLPCCELSPPSYSFF